MTKTSKPSPTAHCQICGRAIKDKTGVIAHHGYTRPGDGYQTSSCYGARHLSYELSCDVIQLAIDANNAWIARTEAALADFLANPPATLDFKRHGHGPIVTATRPADFKPAEGSWRSEAYANAFERRRGNMAQGIRAAKAANDYLAQRLADWKAPA